MSEDAPDREQLAARIEELTETVETLERELRRPRRGRRRLGPPRAEDLRRFTAEVAIPGTVLLLEANVRALKLLQRTLRAADDRDAAGEGTRELARQAGDVGSTALARLEDALADVQSALEGEPPDGEARELLAEARELRADVQSQLDGTPADDTPDRPEVDVESELQSIKDQMEDDDGDEEK
jgi:hypothetical protein